MNDQAMRKIIEGTLLSKFWKKLAETQKEFFKIFKSNFR